MLPRSARVLPVVESEDGSTAPSNRAVSTVRWSQPSGLKARLSEFGSSVGASHGPPSQAHDVADRVRSASQLRMGKSSIFHSMAAGLGPGAQTLASHGSRNGAIASYFYAPHPRPGQGVCFSPRGDLLLKFGFGPEFKLMKSVNGSLANTFKGSPGNVRFAAFSADGAHIMAASDDMHLFVYDVAKALAGTQALEVNIDVGAEPVAYCLMSPDKSRILSCDDDGQLEMWCMKTKKMLSRYETGHSSVLASFSRDGKTIVSCADFECGVVLLNAETAEVLCNEPFDQLREGRNKAGYCISADGRRVVVYVRDQTWSENLAIYDVDSQTYTIALVCSGTLLDVQFSADGEEFIASGRDNLIHVFDSETTEPVSALNGHQCDVMFCRVSGDRQYAISGDSDGLVYVWDIVHSRSILRLQAHNAPVVSCDISLDGTRAFTLDSEGHAHLWYLEMQGILDVLQQQSDQLTCCQVTADGRRMAVGYADGTLRLWSMGLGVSQVWQHNVHTCSVECLAVNPNTGAVVTGARDGLIVLSGITGGQVLAMLRGHTDVVTGLAFSFDGSALLSSCRDGHMCLWAVDFSGRHQREEPRVSLGASPLGKRGGAQQAVEGAVEVTPKRVFKDPGESFEGLRSCALNPRGTIAVGACSTGAVSFWDVATGQQLHKVMVSDLHVTSLQFRDDGRHLVAGASDGSVSVLEADSGRVLSTLEGNASGISSVYFEHGGGMGKDLADCNVVSVCSRQAVTWELAGSGTVQSMADFIADESGDFFRNKTMQDRVFVAHSGLTIYDPLIKAAMYDMRTYDTHPGNSALFAHGTAVLTGGVHHEKMILYTPPDKSIEMLVNETGGVKCLDFSPSGKLLVSGNLRGELCVWDVVHRQQVCTWMAHKRSAINCVKFSHDAMQVYSCGEDAKVVLWNWRDCSQAVTLSGHQAPVVSVDMSLNGLYMVSGDKSGIVIIWDAIKLDAKQVLALHDGAVLCVSINPDGSRIISSGKDEHVCVIDSETGEEVFNLDDALDGRGLTVKFSFEGTRLLLGSEKGDILIWSVENDCLLYDIQAHVGSVYECSWSGDSRRLLSVGTDGRARLWDAAAGSELCQANFEHGFGVVDSGGFVKCDLSSDGTVMAGCTAKGHLILWDIGRELHKAPNGQMLYQWLASMPVQSAKRAYTLLLDSFPLLYNAQDSRGWTVLMHAAANCNPEIVKVIISTIMPYTGRLGLMASPLRRQPDFADGRSLARFVAVTSGASTAANMRNSNNALPSFVEEPNAIRIAIDASSGDCVHHLLNAVLDEKVTAGSYHSVTKALSDVAIQYPELCEAFLTGLSLRSLGEIEIPSHIAAQGTVVIAATSYTSYKELWEHTLRLDRDETARGPMVVMEAVMVRLPFPASVGSESLLHTLGESRVPVRTFGSETVNAIIKFKWGKFAQRQIYTKSFIYLAYLLLFTAYAIILSNDYGPIQINQWPPVDNSTTASNSNSSDSNATNATTYIGEDFKGLWTYGEGRATVILSFVVFMFGTYFMSLEGLQLVKLGPTDYFSSFWNFMDLCAYAASIVIPPCVLMRWQMNDGGFVYPLVAVETILLWAKSLFYGLAVDGLGTFIYMIIQVIKGLKFFYVLLAVMFISFGVALQNLFRYPPSGDPNVVIFPFYNTTGNAMLSLFNSMLQNQDSRGALGTTYYQIAIIVCCLYAFFANIIMINLIITLMSDLYASIKQEQDLVFLRNRADLILEVESTMSRNDVIKYRNIPPYLHLLKPIDLENKREEAKRGAGKAIQYSSSRAPDDSPGPKPGKGGGGGGGAVMTSGAHMHGRGSDDEQAGTTTGNGAGQSIGLSRRVGGGGELSRSPSMAGGGWMNPTNGSLRSSKNGYEGGGGGAGPGGPGKGKGGDGRMQRARSRGGGDARSHTLMKLESFFAGPRGGGDDREDRFGFGGGGGAGSNAHQIAELQSALDRQGRELAFMRRAMEMLLKHQMPHAALPLALTADDGAGPSAGPSPSAAALKKTYSVRHGKGVAKTTAAAAAAAAVAQLPLSPGRGSPPSASVSQMTTFSPQGSSWDIDQAMSVLAANQSRPLRHSNSGSMRVREVAKSQPGDGSGSGGDSGGAGSGVGAPGGLRPSSVFPSFKPSAQKSLPPVPEVRERGDGSSLPQGSERGSDHSVGPGPGPGHELSLAARVSPPGADAVAASDSASAADLPGTLTVLQDGGAGGPAKPGSAAAGRPSPTAAAAAAAAAGPHPTALHSPRTPHASDEHHGDKGHVMWATDGA